MRLRVQKRQYMAHWLLTRKRTRSGYLWTSRGTGLRASSASGSAMQTVSESSRDIRDGLFPQGVVRFADQPEIIGVDPHRIGGDHLVETGGLAVQLPLQARTAGDTVAQNLLPGFHNYIIKKKDFPAEAGPSL